MIKKFNFIFGEDEQYIRIPENEDRTLYVSYLPGKEVKYIKSTPVSKVINMNFAGSYEYINNGKKIIVTFDIDGKVKGFPEYDSYEIYLDDLDCSRYNCFCFKDKKDQKRNHIYEFKGKYLYIFDNPESDRYHSDEKGKLLYKLKKI